jgi:hypothetical protein
MIEILSLPLAHRLQNPPANGNQGPVPEEISQTLLTIRSNQKTAKFKFISMENQRNPLTILKHIHSYHHVKSSTSGNLRYTRLRFFWLRI